MWDWVLSLLYTVAVIVVSLTLVVLLINFPVAIATGMALVGLVLTVHFVRMEMRD